MEQALDLYKRPYDPKLPVVCMNESPRQRIGETRIPPLQYAWLKITLSRVERGAFIMGCHPLNEINDLWMGLWLTTEYGSRWELRIENSTLGQYQIRLFENDTLFDNHTVRFPTDFGSPWHADWTGLDSTEQTTISSASRNPFRTGEDLFVVAGDRWFRYRDGGWERIRDTSGTLLKRAVPATLDAAGEYLYCGYPNRGLYRVRTKQTPTTAPAAPSQAPT